MPRGTPLDPAARAQVIELHAAGLSRNEIARQTEVSTFTVSGIVKAAGGTFDRSTTAVATAARRVDLAARRADINAQLLARAKEFLDQMDQPFLVYSFGGRENTYAEQMLTRPPSQDIRNLMNSVSLAIQRSNELSAVDADPNEGLPAVDAWLVEMTSSPGAAR